MRVIKTLLFLCILSSCGLSDQIKEDTTTSPKAPESNIEYARTIEGRWRTNCYDNKKLMYEFMNDYRYEKIIAIYEDSLCRSPKEETATTGSYMFLDKIEEDIYKLDLTPDDTEITFYHAVKFLPSSITISNPPSSTSEHRKLEFIGKERLYKY